MCVSVTVSRTSSLDYMFTDQLCKLLQLFLVKVTPVWCNTCRFQGNNNHWDDWMEKLDLWAFNIKAKLSAGLIGVAGDFSQFVKWNRRSVARNWETFSVNMFLRTFFFDGTCCDDTSDIQRRNGKMNSCIQKGNMFGISCLIGFALLHSSIRHIVPKDIHPLH